jgi:uncharacterized protein (TIGR02271 family)
LNPLPESANLITAAGRGRYRRQAENDEVLVILDDGRRFRAPAGLINQQPDGQFFLNLPLGDIQARLKPGSSAHASESVAPSAAAGHEELVVPVVQEELSVGKRQVETGRVRVRKVVHEQVEDLETLLQRDEVEVERVPVNEYVDAVSPVEYADDRVVIPIYEEVAVVEKRLLLKERLVVTRRQVQSRDVQPVSRRVEEAVVERLPGAGHDSEPG